MAGLSPAEIAQPIRAIVSGQRNVTVLMATVVDVDPERRRVRLDDGTLLDWDFLVVACEASDVVLRRAPRPLGTAVAPGLKSIEDAVEDPAAGAPRVRAGRARARPRAPRAARQLRGHRRRTHGRGAGGRAGRAVAVRARSRLSFATWIPRVGARSCSLEKRDRAFHPPVPFPADLAGERGCRSCAELGVEVRTGARVMLDRAATA